MQGLVAKTREVFDKQMESIRAEDESSGQETRVSVWMFGGDLRNICFDASLDRVPAARSFYTADMGTTALIDSTIQVIRLLNGIPTIGGDHAFLLYVQTDGQEMVDRNGGPRLRKEMDRLSDDYTVAITVPNKMSEREAIAYGFPADNIQIWHTTEKGLQELGDTMIGSTQSYYSTRAMGQKSTKMLFKLPEVTKAEVKQKLDEVDPGSYETLLVRPYDHDRPIKDFVEAWTKKPYRLGSAYFQLTKAEKVQGNKVVAVVEKSTGKMFSGPDARKLLNLPNCEVKVAAADFRNFDVFVQSHSCNRKLVQATHLIVFK